MPLGPAIQPRLVCHGLFKEWSWWGSGWSERKMEFA